MKSLLPFPNLLVQQVGYSVGQSACDTEYRDNPQRISDLARNHPLTKVAIAIPLLRQITVYQEYRF